MPSASKSYDRAYFDRWYRDPRHAVQGSDDLARRVQLAVAVAEFLLDRPIQTVLDVGCGEARWRALLRAARPSVQYIGVDASEYVVRRFGRRRDIRLGSLGRLRDLGLTGRFDLVVCADVLHYVGDAEALRGLRAIRKLLGGVAYLELFTRDDATVGDDHDFQPRSAVAYRRLLEKAGLIHVGVQCWVGRALARELMEFERAEARGTKRRVAPPSSMKDDGPLRTARGTSSRSRGRA